jgi:hypothetical protein
MKFSITNLEKARKNPVEFAKLLSGAKSAENGFSGYPKSMRWLNAVCEFHKKGNLSDAFESIENGFSRRKNTAQHRRELAIFYQSLDKYKTETSKRKLALLKSREPILIRVNSQVEISGIIPLIFMKPSSGFAAYFISLQNPAWRSELKFPVVQSFVAETVFKTRVTDIEVGYIDYFTGEFNEVSFSHAEIKDSGDELQNIGKIIQLNL